MTERSRARSPKTVPHIKGDPIVELAMENPDTDTADHRAEHPPQEELLDFLEGNPGGRPCRHPFCPETDI